MAIRYGIHLTNLPVKIWTAVVKISMFSMPYSAKGGLITQRHNENRDLLGDLSYFAWTYTQKEPVIRKYSEALRADLLIRGFWGPQDTASFDIPVTNT